MSRTDRRLLQMSQSHVERTWFDPLLSIPQQIPYDRRRNLDRLGEPEQAHDDSKVNADTETARQDDSDEAGEIGESRRLKPPASSRGGDCADQLRAHGVDHECGADAYRAARIDYRGHGNE